MNDDDKSPAWHAGLISLATGSDNTAPISDVRNATVKGLADSMREIADQMERGKFPNMSGPDALRMFAASMLDRLD